MTIEIDTVGQIFHVVLNAKKKMTSLYYFNIVINNNTLIYVLTGLGNCRLSLVDRISFTTLNFWFRLRYGRPAVKINTSTETQKFP